MRRAWRFAGLLAVALAVLAAPPFPATACNTTGGDDSNIPFEVEVTGRVTQIDGRSFRIGGVTIERPRSRRRLTWCGEPYWDIVEFDPIHVGDRVYVDGSLRLDATVLAYVVTAADDGTDGSSDPEVVAGVVQSVETRDDGDGPYVAACAIDGATYSVVNAFFDNSYYYLAGPSDDGIDAAFDDVAVGDAVLLRYAVDAGGARVADEGYVRMAGGETTLSGVVTYVRADQPESAEIEVDGVPVYWDESTVAFSRDRRDAVPDLDPTDAFPGVAAGQIVAVAGTLRDGWIFADRLVVRREPDSRGAARLAKRAGRLHARGMIERGAQARAVTVSGLAMELSPRAARAMAKSATASPSSAVRVDAWIRDGAILAARIRRR